MPNPAGGDDINESITLRNTGTSPISLAGWSVRDLTGAKWDLAGTIGAGQQRVVKRSGQAMSLNNGGDTIDLINSTGQLVQTVSYGPSAEDQVVRP